MRTVGLCHICGKPASNTCALCGKSACTSHYDKTHGICTSCMRGKSANGGKSR